MAIHLRGIEINNFRSLARLDLKLGDINVLFGPNGAGKTNFLDAIQFVQDCTSIGISEAAAKRSQAIGMLYDQHPDAYILIKLETSLANYEMQLGFDKGRVRNTLIGEKLSYREKKFIERSINYEEVAFFSSTDDIVRLMPLRDPDQLALSTYLTIENNPPEALEINNLLKSMRFYLARSFDLLTLRKYGSASTHNHILAGQAENLWSVLRNLHDRQALDKRYDTIIGFMQAALPSFKNIVLEQTGLNSVYSSFIEKKRRLPIPASSVPDGELQLLILLTALFSESKEQEQLILFDEPDISLHPHALAVFADAVKEAAQHWNRQIIISTHSPVLISQFENQDILAVELNDEGQTTMKRVSDMEGIQDLLEEYATGSLYMAELIAPQSRLEADV